MHRLLPVGAKPGTWSPRLSSTLVRLARPLRVFAQRHIYGVAEIEIQQIARLQSLIAAGMGILIACNHVTYPDPFVLAEASQRAKRPFYYMTAWQVFGAAPWIKRAVLQRLGCFSVDREGADLGAFRTAVEILCKRPNPLAIFPEGELYHTNDRVMPFHEGAAAIALAAARKADRPIACLPCALHYEYVGDPTPQLCRLLDSLEQRFFWRPAGELPLVGRVYRLAEGALALKEIEYLGQTQAGVIPNRLRGLCTVVLDRLDRRYGLTTVADPVPRRVKRVRQAAIQRLSELPDDAAERAAIHRDLDDVFLAVQLFSYPGDYLSERPTLGRLADTLDKLEEDILGVPHATVRGTRRATLLIGEPLPVARDKSEQPSPAELTCALEASVQASLELLARSRHTPDSRLIQPEPTSNFITSSSC
jgi:1-acyl-sn-glycerol-3-phosphate acyltransferase